MIIKKVALKNIKSYGEESIEFQEGVTSIHGLNGAGKSTVLEAIGYALFDSLPYSQAEFVRKGEKTGVVDVTVLGVDGIEYTVTRKCGSSQEYSLRDGNGIVIAGKDDVGGKLCGILGYRVADIGQLRSLFENAVGVLQGTFVSEFLESAGKRKGIFDPLLRIDEYSSAHRNLLPLKNLIMGSITGMKLEISKLEGKTEQKGRLEKDRDDLARQRDGLKSECSAKKGLMQKALAEKELYDAVEDTLRDLDGMRRVASAESGNKRETLGRIRAELKKSEEAMRTLERNEASFRLYASRMEEKEALEKRRGERDELLKKSGDAGAAVRELGARLADYGRALKELEAYELEIKTLEPLAAEQERLDAEARRLMAEISSRRNELARLGERMKPLTTRGSMCPVLPDVECRSITDFQSHYEAEISRIASVKTGLEDDLKGVSERLKALKDPRLLLNTRKEALKKKEEKQAGQASLQAQLDEKREEQASLVPSLSAFGDLENQTRAVSDELRRLKPAHDEYQQNVRIAGLAAERQKEIESAAAELEKKEAELKRIDRTIEETRAGYDADSHAAAKSACEDLRSKIAALEATIQADDRRIDAIGKELGEIGENLEKMASIKKNCKVEADYLAFVERFREIIRMAGPEVIRVYIELISKEATDMYCEISGDRRFEVRWTSDYNILLIEEGRERTFRQLSGGEQMSAALAVRLAILKILTSSDVVFLDEPTQNLDEGRRENLAREIMRIKDFRQMIVISHDDTFNASLENVVEIEKTGGQSRVRRRNARPQATLP